LKAIRSAGVPPAAAWIANERTKFHRFLGCRTCCG
jgi:hypothetical protein